jgi:hypothetical protein
MGLSNIYLNPSEEICIIILKTRIFFLRKKNGLPMLLVHRAMSPPLPPISVSKVIRAYCSILNTSEGI